MLEMEVDALQLNFDEGKIMMLNACMSFVMFGVALGIDIEDFKKIFQKPKPIVIGVLSQFIVLPILSYLLVLVFRPEASIAMGMILLASCPGGNFSNFISSLSKANVALSVSLTSVATVLSVIMTPLNFTLWTGLYLSSGEVNADINIPVLSIFQTILFLIAIPLALGLFCRYRFEKITHFINKPIKWLSIVIFLSFIVFAFMANYTSFIAYIGVIFLIVFIHNSSAFISAYFFAKWTGLQEKDRRAIAIETGIQNAGLGLIITFNFFNGLGGMALVCAWWGVWHLISGLTLALFWSRKTPVAIEN